MSLSNTAQRTVWSVEKSHSLHFSVRVEDRLHTNILQPDDLCWFTVRPVEYTTDFDDSDIVNGTDAVEGTGIVEAGAIVGTGDARRFSFEVQAARLNLDPELDWWYDVTYVRDGYSISVAAGSFRVSQNVTNRGVQEEYSDVAEIFELVAGFDSGNLLTVSSTIPLPMQGEPGLSAYLAASAFAETVGDSVTFPISLVEAPPGFKIEVGTVLFSSVTRGVLGTVAAIDLDAIPPTVEVLTRQNYSLQALKALLDTVQKTPGAPPNLETIEFAWAVPKIDVPLPVGYDYRVGDMVFSHSALSGLTLNRKLIISLIESQTATHLNVRTKVVFPMFLGNSDINDLLATKADASRTVNGQALTSNVLLTEDSIPAGVTNQKFTGTEKTKLSDLYTRVGLDAALAGKANSSHSHTIANVTGLSAALDNKVDSTDVDTITIVTQAAYDAIVTPNARTLYLIRG